MRVLFITNYPSPYRVDFFNLLGKSCDLVVCFLTTPEEQHHRSEKWFNNDYSGFKAVFLSNKTNLLKIKTDIKKIIMQSFDYIIFGGYSSPTQMYAMEYLHNHNIPYYIEADGGLIKKDSFIRKCVKKHYVSNAAGCIGSGNMTRKYFTYYGAKDSNIFDYCFTSQKEKDLKDALMLSDYDRKRLKNILSVSEENYIATICNSIDDSRLNFFKILSDRFNQNVGIYILTFNAESFEQNFGEYTNIHIIEVSSDFDIAKYLAASDLYLNLDCSNNNTNMFLQARIFGIPLISIKDFINKSYLEMNIDVQGIDVDSLFIKLNDIFISKTINENYIIERSNELFNVIKNKKNSEYEIYCIELLRNIIRFVTKNALKLNDNRIVIAVGQFIHRKGFDVLLKAASDIDAEIYIIGGKPDGNFDQYQDKNVHFLDFMTKDKLREYYRAADVFAMPTREDIWGLVVNEALSYGLPVVTTDKCVAGLELIKPGLNGYIVPVEDYKSLALSINNAAFLKAIYSYKSISDYTMENMTERHIEILEGLKRNNNVK